LKGINTLTQQPIQSSGLARRRLGTAHLVFFTVSASAPMTVLAGGVTTTFAVTHVVGVPLSFPILAIALALFAVGYAAMSRYVSNAGAFYAYLANGLGKSTGVAGSFVALVAYSAIKVGLYGLFGAVFGAFAAEKFKIEQPWWVWSLASLILVGLLGILRVDLNARILSVLLILECLAVLAYDIGAFGHPAAGGITAAGLRPSDLFVNGVGGVFAFGIAAFVGFESAAVYSEECRDPGRTVARATYAALAVTGVLYAVSAWALVVGTGPGKVTSASPGEASATVFAGVSQYWGAVVGDLANVLFLTSIFAALLSFHNGVARYLFALGRERVLAPALGRTGVGSGAPVGGSLLVSLLGAVVVVAFAVLNKDPVAQLFTWLSYIAAVGVLLLMTGTSVAVIGFFSRKPDLANVWQRIVAPILGTIALAAITGVTIYNSDSVLGTDKESPLRWILPGIVVVAAVIGLAWGLAIRWLRPEIYEGIGRGATEPKADTSERVPVIV
jgi:amino acid transporter